MTLDQGRRVLCLMENEQLTQQAGGQELILVHEVAVSHSVHRGWDGRKHVSFGTPRKLKAVRDSSATPFQIRPRGNAVS